MPKSMKILSCHVVPLRFLFQPTKQHIIILKAWIICTPQSKILKRVCNHKDAPGAVCVFNSRSTNRQDILPRRCSLRRVQPELLIAHSYESYHTWRQNNWMRSVSWSVYMRQSRMRVIEVQDPFQAVFASLRRLWCSWFCLSRGCE